jgi:hypothetical protein
VARGRECRCDGRHGRLRRTSRVQHAWTVVDGLDHELARITRRKFLIEREPEDARTWWARWGSLTRSIVKPEALATYEVVDSGPEFDWTSHGILVALAGLKQQSPPGGGP